MAIAIAFRSSPYILLVAYIRQNPSFRPKLVCRPTQCVDYRLKRLLRAANAILVMGLGCIVNVKTIAPKPYKP